MNGRAPRGRRIIERAAYLVAIGKNRFQVVYHQRTTVHTFRVVRCSEHRSRDAAWRAIRRWERPWMIYAGLIGTAR